MVRDASQRGLGGGRTRVACDAHQYEGRSNEVDDRVRADNCVGETNLRVCRASSHCSGIVIYNENTNSKL